MSEKENEKPEKGKRGLFGCMPLILVVVVLVIVYQMGRSSGVRSVGDSPEQPAAQRPAQNTVVQDTRPMNQRFQRIPLESELPGAASPAAARTPVAIRDLLVNQFGTGKKAS